MKPDKSTKADKMGLWCDSLDAATETAKIAGILEAGR